MCWMREGGVLGKYDGQWGVGVYEVNLMDSGGE